MVTNLWNAELESWGRHQRARGRPETTIGLRLYHLRRIAAALEVGPWQVTGDQLVDWLGSQSWSLETRRSWRSSCRGFWGWGLATGRTSSSPALALESIRRQEPRPRPTPDPTYKRAVLAADSRERLMLRLADELGLRRGEVALVHRRDLVEDLAGWSLVVHGKGGRERVLPLTDDLARAVRVATTDGWAFPGRINGHLSPAHVGKLISRLMPEGVSMHSVRHRCASRMYSQTGDVLLVQSLLGHASPETTIRYVKVENDRLRAAVTRLAEAS